MVALEGYAAKDWNVYYRDTKKFFFSLLFFLEKMRANNSPEMLARFPKKRAAAATTRVRRDIIVPLSLRVHVDPN